MYFLQSGCGCSEMASDVCHLDVLTLNWQHRIWTSRKSLLFTGHLCYGSSATLRSGCKKSLLGFFFTRSHTWTSQVIEAWKWVIWQCHEDEFGSQNVCHDFKKWEAQTAIVISVISEIAHTRKGNLCCFTHYPNTKEHSECIYRITQSSWTHVSCKWTQGPGTLLLWLSYSPQFTFVFYSNRPKLPNLLTELVKHADCHFLTGCMGYNNLHV